MEPSKTNIVIEPSPRRISEVFDEETYHALSSGRDVIILDNDTKEDEFIRAINGADFIISQRSLSGEMLDDADRLKAIFNVEGNFLPNIDYEACQAKNIHVLTPSGVFALPVAEIALGMALSLLRGIHTAHIDFLRGQERYGFSGNREAKLLSEASVGIIGYGDIARSLHGLLGAFGVAVSVYDPWLPDRYLRINGLQPVGLNDLLKRNNLIFVCAAATSENQGFLGRERLMLISPDSALVLLSRASVVDFDCLTELALSGRLRIATDVFPDEPLSLDHPIRGAQGSLLSAHRAGALEAVIFDMGRYVLDDISLMEKGLSPVSCRKASLETVVKSRSKPVTVT